MSEGIISEEDREFVSSLGHWTGDATWDPGPIGGWSGLALFSIGIYPDIKSIQLSSPNVSTPTNKQVGFVIYTHFPSPVLEINRRLTITDGAYSFVRPWSYQTFPDEWLAVGLAATLPSDWDKFNVSISLEIQMAVLGFPGIAYADRSSLIWAAAKQYLPILGIG